MTERHWIMPSDLPCLHLTDKEYAEYKLEVLNLHIKYMQIEYKARGIWAGNQNKYVQTPDQLNDWDNAKQRLELLRVPT